MASRLEVTPELIETIRLLAYQGLNQEEIAQKLNRDRDTLFFNSKDKYPELLSAYNNGKREHKHRLLSELDELSTEAKSEEVQFKSKKYLLNVLHKVYETSKNEVTGEDGKDLIPQEITIKIG
jgi:hypothetical protein